MKRGGIEEEWWCGRWCRRKGLVSWRLGLAIARRKISGAWRRSKRMAVLRQSRPAAGLRVRCDGGRVWLGDKVQGSPWQFGVGERCWSWRPWCWGGRRRFRGSWWRQRKKGLMTVTVSGGLRLAEARLMVAALERRRWKSYQWRRRPSYRPGEPAVAWWWVAGLVSRL